MRFRKLRIAWSVAWGVVAVLQIVLWVRSYGDTDPAEFIGVPVWAINGSIRIYDPSPPPATISEDSIYIGDECIGLLPIWSLATGAIAFASLPWLPWRFNLRTLLIATTLVAVVLGMIAAVLRWPAA